MPKKPNDFMTQYIEMMALHGFELENLINRKRDELSQEVLRQRAERFKEQQAEDEQKALARRTRIAEYYECCLQRNNFYISAQEIIDNEFDEFAQNYWEQAFRGYGEFATTNPFYQMDLEQRLFFLGVSDVIVLIENGQFKPILSPLLEGLQLKDVMAHFKPIEETSGVFADEIPKIREKLALFKDSLGNVE